jgi:hypothetical protein
MIAKLISLLTICNRILNKFINFLFLFSALGDSNETFTSSDLGAKSTISLDTELFLVRTPRRTASY